MFKDWLLVLIWSALIFLGSALPGASVSENRALDFLAHKLVHLFEYSVLFVLIHRAVKRSLLRVHCSLFSVLSFLLTVGYAITDEIHQSFVPGRDARLTDVFIDASAALLVWLFIKRSRVLSMAKPLTKVILLSLLLLISSPVKAASYPSFSVPEGYELKEGEIDHLGGVIELFDTRAAAISFKPDFNFDLAGFATFVYSYEKHYGELDPSVFSLSIYEKAMEHVNLGLPPLSNAKRLITTVVEGNAGEAPTYQLFFGFEPIPVKAG